ncbi:TonB family protein [Sphingomonas sp. BAUL-RG-20F-R05-02]|uniref:TonB family protein n=1 Tax=Sphingomonas sp. BAUL-RG-20F-R05-02 TaxID=2914830 RepID=UPI001F5AF346|nr:TonB family protein [Sphingomonas sp. BAUL-RG-20F-R05-02]
MYADRYGRHGRINPGSFILALTINGAILGGLVLFANPTFKKQIEHHLKLIPIAADPLPPPPSPPPPKPHPELKVEPALRQPVDTSKSVIVTTIADPTPLPLPTFTPGPIDGTGTVGTATVEPVKPLPPVLTTPTIDPRYANLFQPVFPPDEQRAGRSGRVVVRVLVGVDGRVKDIARVSATSDSFYDVTRKRALDKWRFKPATRDSIPVEAWREVAVSFVLAEGE